jgi:hypothetical protein
LVLNVLLYFALGLFMLGQVRLVTLRKVWSAQKTELTPGLASRWVRYCLAFLALTSLIAFLLPTRYTLGLLDLVSTLVWIVMTVLGFLYTLLMFLLSLPMWLIAKLFGREPESNAPPFEMSRPSFPAPREPVMRAGWLEMARMFLFWVLLVGVVSYVIWRYLREHPEIWRALVTFAPFRALRTWWRLLRRRFGSWQQTVRRRLRGEAPEEGALAASGPRGPRWFGLRSPRERIWYHYLGVLRRARRRGLPRRATETPREYGAVLKPRLPETEAEVESLTEAFVEARYSLHPVQAEQVVQARTWGQRIRAALRGQRFARRSGGRRVRREH